MGSKQTHSERFKRSNSASADFRRSRLRARHGSDWVDDSFPGEFAAKKEEAQASRRTVLIQFDEADYPTSLINIPSLETEVKSIKSLLRETASAAIVSFQSIAEEAERMGQFLRSLQFQWSDFRAVTPKDPLDVAIQGAAFVTLEGFAAAFLMTADGQTGIFGGLGYGFSFAAATVLTGLSGGFWGRLAFFQKDAQIRTVSARNMRRKGLTLFYGHALAALMSIFVSARIRAIGDHKGIFDFSKVTLADTFNDGISLILVIFGLISFLTAAYKGAKGLSDIRWGFSEAYHASRDGLAVQVEKLCNAAEDRIDGVVYPLVERLSEALDRSQEAIESLAGLQAKYRDAVRAHNDAIDQSVDQLRSSYQRRRNAAHHINPGSLRFEGLPELDGLTALKLPLPGGSDPSALGEHRKQADILRNLIASVEAARNEAFSEVARLRALPLAHQPDIDFTVS
jgi:hypothetical protein